jgi:hypothetical protein
VNITCSVKTHFLRKVERDKMRLMICSLLSLLFGLIYAHDCESMGEIVICEGDFITLEKEYCGKKITMVDDVNFLDLRKCTGKKSTVNFLIQCPVIIFSNCNVINEFQPENCKVSDNNSVVHKSHLFFLIRQNIMKKKTKHWYILL